MISEICRNPDCVRHPAQKSGYNDGHNRTVPQFRASSVSLSSKRTKAGQARWCTSPLLSHTHLTSLGLPSLSFPQPPLSKALGCCSLTLILAYQHLSALGQNIPKTTLSTSGRNKESTENEALIQTFLLTQTWLATIQTCLHSCQPQTQARSHPAGWPRPHAWAPPLFDSLFLCREYTILPPTIQTAWFISSKIQGGGFHLC